MTLEDGSREVEGRGKERFEKVREVSQETMLEFLLRSLIRRIMASWNVSQEPQ